MIAASRRFSPLLRLVWATTALVTVWCLGCSAFDPLLALLGGSSGPMMVCASDGVVSASQESTVATTSSTVETISVAPVSSPTTHGDVCGCQSCQAAESDRLQQQIAAEQTPRVERIEPTAPASVTRSPLLPPPQRVS
jgi:hypothetical protein